MIKKIAQTVYFLSFFAVTTLSAQGLQPLLWWKMEDSTTNNSLESKTQTAFVLTNNFSKPELAAGVAGRALRLNGYSNWLKGVLPTNLPSNQLTLSVWLALESYPLSTAGIFSNLNTDRRSGLALLVNKFGQLSTSVTVNNTIITSALTSVKLEKFAWQHVLLVANATTGIAKLYLNGQPLSTTTLPTGNLSFSSADTIYIGKSTVETLAGIFNTNTINALVDEVKIFDASFSDTQADSLFKAEKTNTIPDLIPENRYKDDLLRPRYHAMPASAWTNEPHGLIFKDGLWHLFFQKNANGPYWGNLNWGHLTSRNLLNWREQKPVLTPLESYDSEGCWSGAIVLDDNGVPTIMYTGVDGRSAQMCLATGNSDMSVFQKATNNPIIADPPVGQSYRDFRDPWIWKEGSVWYMIVGSGINSAGSGGTVIMYSSNDLRSWNFMRLLKIGRPATDNTGTFWEMPLFVKFPDNRRVLLVNRTPEGTTPARMLYWTGTFDGDLFTPTLDVPRQFEQDNGQLSPSVFTEATGRIVAMGIIPDNVNAEFQKAKGYAHNYSLPREWSLSASGTIRQKPIAELARLRGKNNHYDNKAVGTNQSNNTPEPKGRQLELRARIATGNAGRVGFEIAKSADGTEKTRIYYDFVTGYLTVDRNTSSTDPSVPRGQMGLPYAVQQGDTLDLHVYLDGTVLEVFLNEDIVISTHIFPQGLQSTGVDLFSQGGTATFLTTDIWEMKNMNDPSVATTDIGSAASEAPITVFPNPTKETLNVQFELTQNTEVELVIYDTIGRTVQTKSLGNLLKGQQMVKLTTHNLPTGLYILTVNGNHTPLSTTRFLKQ